MSEKIERIRELVNVITDKNRGWHEFYMSIPARPDHDADLVLSWAADELERLTAENERLREVVKQANIVVARYAEATHSGGDFARLEDAINSLDEGGAEG